MAHIRNRYLLSAFKKTLGYSPIVGILGHRQVGKTTLVEAVCNKYFTLDQKSVLQEIKKDPELFLKNNAQLKTALDECQLAPDLFSALKERVRVDKRPGQYILSGSVRFTSRKAIRESLTGRVLNLELIPFTISELNKMDRPKVLTRILKSSSLQQALPAIEQELSLRKSLSNQISNYLNLGGLPGICFVREANIRKQKLHDQLYTILDRDIRLVYPTTLSYSQILELAQFLSIREGQKIKYSDIKKEIGVTVGTIKKLLFALENIFVLRILSIVGDEKGFVVYLEDQAEAKYLDPNKSRDLQMEGLIFRHIRQEFFYQLGMTYRFCQFSTRGGSRVPFVIETPEGNLGILPIEEPTPNRAEMASAGSFLKFYEKSKLIMLNQASKVVIVNNRILQIPTCLVL